MWDENYWIFERIKLKQLRVEYPHWSVGQYAKVLNHDRKWVQKWCKRLDAVSTVTLETLKSRSRAPHHVPKCLSEKAKDLVVELRHELSEQFHRRAGAKLILYGLEQYRHSHEVAFKLPNAASTIGKILRERGCVRAAWKSSYEPVILPAPLEEWEMDFGEVYLLDEAERFEFFLTVDRGTSRVMFVASHSGYNAAYAIETVVNLLVTCGVPRRLRFDRDPRLWGAWTRDSYPSPMIRLLRVLGVEPIVCPPRRPDKKPFVERCIGTLKYEWLAKQMPINRADAVERLQAFPHYYNATRPHQGRACQNRPPDLAFPHLPALPPLPDKVDPDRWLLNEHGRTYRRSVNASGTIQIDRHTYTVGSRYAGKAVLVHLDAHQQLFHLIVEGHLIRSTPILGLVGHPLPFEDYVDYIRHEAVLMRLHRQAHWEKDAR